MNRVRVRASFTSTVSPSRARTQKYENIFFNDLFVGLPKKSRQPWAITIWCVFIHPTPAYIGRLSNAQRMKFHFSPLNRLSCRSHRIHFRHSITICHRSNEAWIHTIHTHTRWKSKHAQNFYDTPTDRSIPLLDFYWCVNVLIFMVFCAACERERTAKSLWVFCCDGMPTIHLNFHIKAVPHQRIGINHRTCKIKKKHRSERKSIDCAH